METGGYCSLMDYVKDKIKKREANLWFAPRFSKLFVEIASECRAVHTAFFWAADFVDQRKLECAVRIGGWAKARRVKVVAESKREILVIKTGAQDQRVHQVPFFKFVGHPSPDAGLESLVAAAAVA